jgi:hypothetical protein
VKLKWKSKIPQSGQIIMGHKESQNIFPRMNRPTEELIQIL